MAALIPTYRKSSSFSNSNRGSIPIDDEYNQRILKARSDLIFKEKCANIEYNSDLNESGKIERAQWCREKYPDRLNLIENFTSNNGQTGNRIEEYGGRKSRKGRRKSRKSRKGRRKSGKGRKSRK